MVIEIEEKCVQLINEEKYCNFFNMLAYYIYNGKNYIYLNKKSLEVLYKSENKIENRSRTAYKQIFDNSSEDLSILKSINRKIIITPDNNKEIELCGKNIKITIDKAIEINFFENKSNLICENLNDCNFFINIEKLYSNIYAKNISNCIALEKNNGGGSTISDVYSEKHKINEVSLLIVDSDQRFKDAPIGTTLKKLLEIKKNDSLVEIYPLYVHEIENLIPLKLLSNFYKSNNGEERRQEVIDFLNLIKKKNLKSQQYLTLI